MAEYCNLSTVPQNPTKLICLNPSTFCLKRRKQVAKQLARKRILDKNQQKFALSLEKSIYKSKDAVYKNLTRNSYKQCTFLGDHDIVLALDDQNCLDIVQLPMNEEIVRDENSFALTDLSLMDASSPFRQPKNLVNKGHPLCTNFKIGSNIYGDRCSKIQSVYNGHAFVVGMESGNMKILTTDRISSSSSSIPTSSLTAFASTAKQTISRKHLLDGSKSYDFIQHEMTCTGPYRRYQRNSDYTLAYQIHNPHFYRLSTELTEIYDNACDRPYVHDIGFIRATEACWDFKESSTSYVDAAHVSRYADSFYLITLDSREPTFNNQNQYRNAVCVDLDMNGNSFVSGVCFINNNVIATSTVNNWNCAQDQSSSIKIWDIRFMRRSRSGFISDLVLPSYPRDAVFGICSKPSFTISNCILSKHDLKSKTENAALLGSVCEYSSNKVIVSITSFDNVGNLLVTLKCPRDGSEEYLIMDPIRQAVIANVKTSDIPDQSQSALQGLKVKAVNRAHGTIALCGSDANSSKIISLLHPHNLSKAMPITKKRGLKRKPDDDHIHPITTSNTINANIKDRFGLQSELSCLSFNESGTKIVGASVDGDIFIW